MTLGHAGKARYGRHARKARDARDTRDTREARRASRASAGDVATAARDLSQKTSQRRRRARGQAPWPHHVLGLGADRHQSEIASQSPRYLECGGDTLPGDERVGDRKQECSREEEEPAVQDRETHAHSASGQA